MVSAATKSVQLLLSRGVEAHCEEMHLADTPTALPNVLYSHSQSVTCRILFKLNGIVSSFFVLLTEITSNTQIYVTLKPTLVRSSLRIFSSYAHAIRGAVAHGWVSEITKAHVNVSFYNGIVGKVERSNILFVLSCYFILSLSFTFAVHIEGDPSSLYHVGQVVLCQVQFVEKLKENYSLHLTFDIQHKTDVPKLLPMGDILKLFRRVEIGKLTVGVVSHTG